MLFNSIIFAWVFLPITLAVYHISYRFSFRWLPIITLTVASLIFYAWWNVIYLPLLVGSIAGNYFIGIRVFQSERRRYWLAAGVILNLSLLGYFKYIIFISDSIADLIDADWNSLDILLPLAISFFTFQQIAYLVDVYRGEEPERHILRYGLFISFFPQLIAGPIVRRRQLLPQLSWNSLGALSSSRIAPGLTLFVLGLAKKVLVADEIAPIADASFAASASGDLANTFIAWLGLLAYTFQIYLDFSGYSDMAIGLAMMLGILLPINFRNPYRAVSVIDFWQRWHITLSNFLRDYLYVPLGGNRKGIPRKYTNLLIVMALGGLWHGAGWTFLVWGLVHGVALVVNHLWRDYIRIPVNPVVGWAMTWATVVIAWIFFRSQGLGPAFDYIASIFDLSGFGDLSELSGQPYITAESIAALVAAIAIAFLIPEMYRLVGMLGRTGSPGIGGVKPGRASPQPAPPAGGAVAVSSWKPGVVWALVTTVLATGVFIRLILGRGASEFVYFQF